MSTNIQKAAMLFGVVFLLVGVLGFVPGITADYSRLGHFDGTGALLLGIFGINVLENIVHLAFGAAGFALARTFAGARAYFLGGGVIYIVVWIYGLVIDLTSNANIIGVNAAANWLHFLLGVVMLGVGLVLGRTGAAGQRRGAIATQG